MLKMLSLLPLAVLSFCISACSTAPAEYLSHAEIVSAETGQISPDEAIIMVRLRVDGPVLGGRWVHFLHEGADDSGRMPALRAAMPVISISSESTGKPLLFKVKAGQLALTQFRSGISTAYPQKPLRTFASAGNVTYIGDIWVTYENSTVSFHVTDEPATIDAFRERYPAFLAKYPPRIRLLKLSGA
jgi:hypothetical protein